MLPMSIVDSLALSANSVATTSVSIPAWVTNMPTKNRVLRLANVGPNNLWFRFDAAATVTSGTFLAANTDFIIAVGQEAAVHILPVSGPSTLSITKGYVYAQA